MSEILSKLRPACERHEGQLALAFQLDEERLVERVAGIMKRNFEHLVADVRKRMSAQACAAAAR